MKLIIVAALAALCTAEKLDRTYLPPASAKTAGGTPGSLQTPLVSGDELPAGGFVNEAQGVVVDAAAAGTRASPGVEETGLGGARPSYGSTASKVGDAAFKESVYTQIPNTFARIAPIPEHETVVGPVHNGQVFKSKTLLPQVNNDYNSNTLSYQNNVESQKYNYGFQTDNGIAVGENGVAHDGIHAQGGYSYKGNDGQDYKVTYTADKGGYQPQGSHLPTPHPIPDDIIKSIEQNAKEEAAGHYDDGSYDSQKYNAEGDYADSNKNDDKLGLFEKRPGSHASGVFINQNSQSDLAFPGFSSVSTDKPLAFTTYKPVYGSKQSGQNHGTFGSSSFGQSAQGGHSHVPSKTQFGQSSFGSQQIATQFGSQFAHGLKPGFGSQNVKPQLDVNQPSQDSSILSNTASSFTQFGSQPNQQSTQDFNIQQNKPQEVLYGKPATSNFGSSISNVGQVESSHLVEKEYLPPLSNDSPIHVVDHQKPEFGVAPTPAFVSGVKPVGFVPQSQGPSAVATASVTGPQSSLNNLSPQVLGGLQSPSKSQPGQNIPQGQAPLKPSLQNAYPNSVPFGAQPSTSQLPVHQFESKPVGLSAASKPISPFPQSIGLIGDKKQPQPAGFLVGSDDSSSGILSKEEDHSYHYNQPAKPFNSPTSTSQGSSLLSGQISQTNNQFSSLNAQSSQKEQISGSGKPNQFLGSASPTSSSGVYQPSKIGVTQAAVSSFPSPSPTPITTFPQKVTAQQTFPQGSGNLFGLKPSAEKEQTLYGQTSSVASVETQKTPTSSLSAQAVPTQQYTGELYEYNKPGQGIVSPTPSSTPSSLGALDKPAQESFLQGSLSSSQFGQPSLSGNKPASKPQFGFGYGSQAGSYFANKQQGYQSQSNTQNVHGSQTQFGSQPFKPFGAQFGSQGLKPQFGTQLSQGSFSQTTQSQPSKPISSSSQFGVSEIKPQFGQGSSFQHSTQQSSQQQSTQGNKLTNIYLPPISITSTLGILGSKPQVGQGSQSFQGSFQQSTQSTQSLEQSAGSVPQAHDSQTHFGSQSNKPLTAASQIGNQEKPQIGQAPQTSFQQTTQQSLGSVQQGQDSQSQFGSQSYKPFASQYGTQGSKPQYSSVPQKSQGNLFQTQTSQSSLSQFGSQSYKPFGSSQFGVSNSKPQFGQPQTSQGTSLTQNQVVQQTVGSQQQSGFGSQSKKPFGSQIGSQQVKPHYGQVTQIQGSSISQTQTTQQTIGSVLNTQQQKQPENVYLPSKPLTTVPQFGAQESKPELGQVSSSQGSSFTQSSQTTQQTVGSLGLSGGQPSKPFGTAPQFGVQGTKPQSSTFGQSQTSQQVGSSVSNQQLGQGSQFLGSQLSKPLGSSQFGIQGVKPQESSFTQSQTTQQTASTVTQQQQGQGSQIYGSQSSKPFGSTQFGDQGVKPQGTSFSQSQTTQQTASTVAQQQPSQGSSIFGSQSSKPFGSSQIGDQGVKPQSSAFGQSQTSQQVANSVSNQQLGQGSQFLGSQPSKPLGSSQFGIQGVKPQGSSFTQSQTTQQTASTVTQQQQGQGSQIYGSQSSKPFGSTQFGDQGVKPQGTSFSQSQTTQQTASTVAQQQPSQGSSIFGSQSSKPFGSSQIGDQGVKPQSSAFGQSQTSQQVANSISNQQLGQGSQFLGSQPSKPLGSSQFGIQGVKPQGSSFTQSQTTQQTASTVTQQQQGQGSQIYGSQSSKPFDSTQFGNQGVKPQGSSLSQSQTIQQTASTVAQQQPSQSSSIFGSKPSKPVGSSQFGIQGVKPQGSSFTQSQTTQQTASTVTQQQSGQGSPIFGPQSSKPFGSTPLGVQNVKPQSSAYGLSQTSQQVDSSLSNQQSGQSSPIFESQPSKPFGSSLFGVQAVKPQGSSFTHTQTSQQTDSTVTQQHSGQVSQIFGSQSSKPFGLSSIGIQENKPQLGQVPQSSQGSSLTQTQTTPQTVGTQQPSASQPQFGSPTYKPFGTSQVGAVGSKPQFGLTQTTQQSTSTFSQSQFAQQSYNKFSQSKPFISSSPAPFTTAFGTQPAKTESNNAQKTEGSSGSSLVSQFGSQLGQSTQGSSQFGAHAFKPFSTSHHQESKPQFGAPSKPVFGHQNTQSQFGYQYKQPVNAFGQYQPKPLFGQTGFTGFGSSQASSSASSFPQAFKGTQFGSQPFRPFGTQIQPIKSQFGLPTSSASAFASSSSTPFPVSGSKFSSQPYGTSSSVFPTIQPVFGQPTTPLGQEISGSQATSSASVQGSDFGSGVSQPSTPQLLGSKPDFGFAKPCCQATKYGQSSTVSPSSGVSSTPSSISTPHEVHGGAHNTEDFKGPKQPQGFNEKTGYYY